MNYGNKLLYRLARSVLKRNQQFVNMHAGETCYIFGNGASLKYMDMGMFNDHVSIGLNFICLHKDIDKLNMPYCVLVQPLFFYPYFKNVYTGKVQSNTRGKLFKTLMHENPDIKIFTSISNIFGSRSLNTHYIHHFGNRTPSVNRCDICGEFSFMAGALYSAIGLAISMGFRKAVLVGCDSIFTPITYGYFYGAGPPDKSDRFENNYKHLIDTVNGYIDLSVVTDTAETSWLPFSKYEDISGKKAVYRENHELVKKDHLESLDYAYRNSEFGVNIYSNKADQHDNPDD